MRLWYRSIGRQRAGTAVAIALCSLLAACAVKSPLPGRSAVPPIVGSVRWAPADPAVQHTQALLTDVANG
ncbi:MAG: hypothetical protein KGR26_06555, partial [Cyanobacteria bacterium REEB65]|nr:hypothetical protein [Cyanobacteria bacterium REEB65]